jgi:hypothetical protein
MSRLPFKSEYDLRLQHCILSGLNWDAPKRKPASNQSMFTPMGPDDYHKDGRLVQERESFEEQKQRVERMVKQQNKL